MTSRALLAVSYPYPYGSKRFMNDDGFFLVVGERGSPFAVKGENRERPFIGCPLLSLAESRNEGRASGVLFSCRLPPLLHLINGDSKRK